MSWGSKLQDVVALSSTEAEYMAMGHAVQEGLYLQMLQLEMGIEPEEGRNTAAARQPVDHQAGEEPRVPQEEQAHCNQVSFHQGEG